MLSGTLLRHPAPSAVAMLSNTMILFFSAPFELSKANVDLNASPAVSFGVPADEANPIGRYSTH